MLAITARVFRQISQRIYCDANRSRLSLWRQCTLYVCIYVYIDLKGCASAAYPFPPPTWGLRRVTPPCAWQVRLRRWLVRWIELFKSSRAFDHSTSFDHVTSFGRNTSFWSRDACDHGTLLFCSARTTDCKVCNSHETCWFVAAWEHLAVGLVNDMQLGACFLLCGN